MPGTDRDPLVQFMVSNPGLAERLLCEHQDDGAGYCRCCAVGAQRGYHSWPCTIHTRATEALRVSGNN